MPPGRKGDRAGAGSSSREESPLTSVDSTTQTETLTFDGGNEQQRLDYQHISLSVLVGSRTRTWERLGFFLALSSERYPFPEPCMHTLGKNCPHKVRSRYGQKSHAMQENWGLMRMHARVEMVFLSRGTVPFAAQRNAPAAIAKVMFPLRCLSPSCCSFDQPVREQGAINILNEPLPGTLPRATR